MTNGDGVINTNTYTNTRRPVNLPGYIPGNEGGGVVLSPSKWPIATGRGSATLIDDRHM